MVNREGLNLTNYANHVSLTTSCGKSFFNLPEGGFYGQVIFPATMARVFLILSPFCINNNYLLHE